MGIYRISRNVEASIIQYIESELTSGGWSGVGVEKTFARIYNISVPSICVRVGDTAHAKAEIGADSTIREAQVLIDIFGSDDGNRLDLKDFLISVLKGGLVYNEYEIETGAIKTTTPNGRIRILNIEDTPIDFDVDKNRLDVHDRYRHLLTLTISLGKVET